MGTRPSPDPTYILRGSKSSVTSLAFSDQVLFSGNQDGQVHQWSLTTRRIKSTLDAHSDHSVLWMNVQSESRLVTQGRDGMVKQWDNRDGHWTNTGYVPSGSLGFCTAAVIQMNNTPLMAVPSQETSQVDIFDMDKHCRTMSLKPEECQQKVGMCMSIKAYSQADCPYILVGYENGSILLWDLRSAKRVSAMNSHSEAVMCMDFSSQLMKGFSGSVDTKIISWTIDMDSSLSQQGETSMTNPGLNDIVVRQDGKLLATAGWDGNIRLFGCKKLKPLAVLSYHKQSSQCLAFSKDNLLACGSKDHLISVWDVYR